jgi:hypothetical protein
VLRPKRYSMLLHLRDRVLRRHSGEVRRLLLEDLQDRLQGTSLQRDHAKLQKAVDQEVR